MQRTTQSRYMQRALSLAAHLRRYCRSLPRLLAGDPLLSLGPPTQPESRSCRKLALGV